MNYYKYKVLARIGIHNTLFNCVATCDRAAMQIVNHLGPCPLDCIQEIKRMHKVQPQHRKAMPAT